MQGALAGAVTTDRNAYSFSTDVRVRLCETDAVGIVFFGSFSAYLDVGRMDYLHHLGLDARRFGQATQALHHLPPGAVAHVDIDFRAPARYNDTLVIHVRVARLGRASYTFHHLIVDKRQPRVIATGRLTLVWLDEAFRPVAIPAEFRSAIEEFEGDRVEAAPLA